MIPRARQAPSASYSGEGRGYRDLARARHTTTRAWEREMADYEYANATPAQRRSLEAWLSGRSLRGS